MTEEEWLNCPFATLMLKYLQDRISERKARLFAVACCRTLGRWLVDNEQLSCAVENAERFADGQTGVEVMEVAYGIAWDTFQRVRYTLSWMEHTAWVVAAAALVPPGPPWRLAYNVVERIMKIYAFQQSPPEPADYQSIVCRYAALLRDVVRNPFRLTPAVDPDRLAGVSQAIPDLARGMYESRRFEEMPILADALEEAGCTDESMLTHCREPGEHVRGCWVLDLVLGKE